MSKKHTSTLHAEFTIHAEFTVHAEFTRGAYGGDSVSNAAEVRFGNIRVGEHQTKAHVFCTKFAEYLANLIEFEIGEPKKRNRRLESANMID